jgi:hypothetical protein
MAQVIYTILHRRAQQQAEEAFEQKHVVRHTGRLIHPY